MILSPLLRCVDSSLDELGLCLGCVIACGVESGRHRCSRFDRRLAIVNFAIDVRHRDDRRWPLRVQSMLMTDCWR